MVSICINLGGKLKEASTICEEGGDPVANLAAVVVRGGESEVVGHLVRVAVGKGQNFQIKVNLKSWSPSWHRNKQFVVFNSDFLVKLQCQKSYICCIITFYLKEMIQVFNLG